MEIESRSFSVASFTKEKYNMSQVVKSHAENEENNVGLKKENNKLADESAALTARLETINKNLIELSAVNAEK